MVRYQNFEMGKPPSEASAYQYRRRLGKEKRRKDAARAAGDMFDMPHANDDDPPVYQYDHAHHYPPTFTFGQIIAMILLGTFGLALLFVGIVEWHKAIR